MPLELKERARAVEDRLGLWAARWEVGQIPFHRAEVYQALIDFFPSRRPVERALVPLCGKSVDLRWLSERCGAVVGAEAVPRAIEDFFTEQALAPTVTERGDRRCYQAGAISIFDGDFLSLSPALTGAVDFCWDRASMVALPAELRGPYISRIRSLLQPAGELLLITYDIDRDPEIGPPYRIGEEEVFTCYEGAEVELLARRPWAPLGGAKTDELIFRVRF